MLSESLAVMWRGMFAPEPIEDRIKKAEKWLAGLKEAQARGAK